MLRACIRIVCEEFVPFRARLNPIIAIQIKTSESVSAFVPVNITHDPQVMNIVFLYVLCGFSFCYYICC